MIKVWDLFVRISHWLLVLLVIVAYITANYGDAEFKWHSFNGYAIFVLVCSRIIWGLIGSTTARFSHFLKSPIRVIKYLKSLSTGKTSHFLGHNPAGGWMVAAFWLILLGQAVAGMFSSDDILAEGPLTYTVSGSAVSTLTGIHYLLFDLLIILIALHIAAVIYHQFFKKEKLIQAMLHGKKPASSNNKQQETNLIFHPFYYALLIIIMVAVLFYFSLRAYL